MAITNFLSEGPLLGCPHTPSRVPCPLLRSGSSRHSHSSSASLELQSSFASRSRARHFHSSRLRICFKTYQTESITITSWPPESLLLKLTGSSLLEKISLGHEKASSSTGLRRDAPFIFFVYASLLAKAESS